jgi:STE24 endopeptidase
LPDPAVPPAEPLKRTPGLKAALAAGVLVYTILFVLTTFPRSAEVEAAAVRYFSKQEIELGLRYAFQRRLFSWSSTAVQLAFLTVVVFSGFGRRVADFAYRLLPTPPPVRAAAPPRITSSHIQPELPQPPPVKADAPPRPWASRRYRLRAGLHWLAAVLVVGLFCYLGAELLVLPLRLGNLANNRAWGMTHRGVLDWLRDYAVALAVAAGFGAVVLTGLYSLIRVFPRRWWLFGALGSVLLGFCWALILPVVINPLFNTFTPLRDRHLKARVMALAERAGVPVKEVLVMDASRHGKHTNAYFTGFGPTRRIVLYDTLLKPTHTLSPEEAAGVVALAGGGPWPLARATPPAAVIPAHRTAAIDEVETILAHEIGHWQHDHIIKGILLAGLGAFVGLYLAARILRWAVGRAPFALRSPADPAGVPLLFLLSVLGSWVVAPMESAVSRSFERQADAVSLDLSRQPAAFIGAEKRLARDNISNVAPTPFSVWLFASHPPVVERIRMAEEWRRQKNEDRGPRTEDRGP